MEFPADGRGWVAAAKKGTSRPLPSHPRPEPESPALDPHPGSPLRPPGRQASVRVQEEERERGWPRSQAIQHLRRSTKLQPWPARMSNPKSPGSEVADPQMSRSALRVRPGLASSPRFLCKGSLSSESILLIPPEQEAAAAQSPSPLGLASPSSLPLCLARKCCKPQIPAFLGRQQVRGMLGFPLCFLRTGLFFYPKASRSGR